MTVSAPVAVGSMPRYIFVVLAYIPRDGGWVRHFGRFRSAEEAWRCIILFWDLTVLAGDVWTYDVVRTVAFR
jgi:hypothetical protein